jgi:hypothetical protein
LQETQAYDLGSQGGFRAAPDFGLMMTLFWLPFVLPFRNAQRNFQRRIERIDVLLAEKSREASD